MSDNKFHDHLDVCKQCREHPFALCAAGEKLLVEEVGEGIPNTLPSMEVITSETQPTFKKE